jgi:hypothetical protein
MNGTVNLSRNYLASQLIQSPLYGKLLRLQNQSRKTAFGTLETFNSNVNHLHIQGKTHAG